MIHGSRETKPPPRGDKIRAMIHANSETRRNGLTQAQSSKIHRDFRRPPLLPILTPVVLNLRGGAGNWPFWRPKKTANLLKKEYLVTPPPILTPPSSNFYRGGRNLAHSGAGGTPPSTNDRSGAPKNGSVHLRVIHKYYIFAEH